MTEIPDGAKKPTDHKAKAEDEPTTRAVTVRGVDITVPVDALNDFELLDDLNELEQRQNAARMPAILRRLVGEQWREVMDAARDPESGRVTIEAGADLVREIMEGLSPN